MINKNLLLNMFNKHKVYYKIHSHKPLFTVDESKKLRGNIEGAHTKNLFLKNKKNNFFLFSCLESTKINLKILKQNLNLGNISFASEKHLKNILGVEPGAVTPFGLLNDHERKIKFFLDLKINEYDSFNFHPLINTYTVNMTKKEFYNFFKINNIDINLINFENYGIYDI